MRAEMDEALLRAARSGAYIMGPQVAELERQLADYVGVKHCISCANGTDALSLALMALNIGPGDAVFVPDFTFFATAETVAMVGATPIFVDVKKETYNIGRHLQQTHTKLRNSLTFCKNLDVAFARDIFSESLTGNRLIVNYKACYHRVNVNFAE